MRSALGVLHLALEAIGLEPNGISTPWNRGQAILRSTAKVELRRVIETEKAREAVDCQIVVRLRREISLCPCEVESTCVECADRWRLIDAAGGLPEMAVVDQPPPTQPRTAAEAETLRIAHSGGAVRTPYDSRATEARPVPEGLRFGAPVVG